MLEVGGAAVQDKYMSIKTLNFLWAATGSQRTETKRGVTWVISGGLKTRHAAAFGISCRGLMELEGGPGMVR